MRGKSKRAEHVRESGAAYIQAAGKGAERRHHQPRAIAGKATPAHRAPAMRDARHRMQMAGNFSFRAGRQMPERDAAERERVVEYAADARDGRRIVVASEPDPLAAALQREQAIAVGARKPRRAAIVVEAVAESEDDARLVARD